jgi:hypothetical protein
MNKHSYSVAAMFFLLLFVNVSRSFGQTTPVQNAINVIIDGLDHETPDFFAVAGRLTSKSYSTLVSDQHWQQNAINVIIDGVDHETPDFTLLRQNLETLLKVKIYSSFSYNMSTLDFLCNKTPSEIWDKLPQDTKDRFKLIRIEPLRIELTTKDAGKDPATSNSSSRTNQEQAIRDAVELFGAALLNNNGSAAASLLADDFVFNASGKRMNKAERLASISSGQYKYGPFKKEDVKVTIYEKTATVVITTVVKYKSGDKDVSVNFSSLTFTKKDEHWQLLGECLMGNGCFK